MSESDTLSKQQLAAVALLAEGARTEATGKAVGVSERTIQRWKSENDRFAATLFEMQQEIVDESLRVLKANAAHAARVMATAMVFDSVTSPQVQAAKDILDRVHGKAILRVGGAGEEGPPLRFTLIHPAAEKADA
jgi:hypothetical protein